MLCLGQGSENKEAIWLIKLSRNFTEWLPGFERLRFCLKNRTGLVYSHLDRALDFHVNLPSVLLNIGCAA